MIADAQVHIRGGAPRRLKPVLAKISDKASKQFSVMGPLDCGVGKNSRADSEDTKLRPVSDIGQYQVRGRDRELPKVGSMDSVMNWIDRKPHRFTVVIGLQTALIVAALVAVLLTV